MLVDYQGNQSLESVQVTSLQLKLCLPAHLSPPPLHPSSHRLLHGPKNQYVGRQNSKLKTKTANGWHDGGFFFGVFDNKSSGESVWTMLLRLINLFSNGSTRNIK